MQKFRFRNCYTYLADDNKMVSAIELNVNGKKYKEKAWSKRNDSDKGNFFKGEKIAQTRARIKALERHSMKLSIEMDKMMVEFKKTKRILTKEERFLKRLCNEK